VLDAKGNRVRHYSSKAAASSGLAGNAPDYWFAAPAVLDTTPGLHRFVWDVRSEDPLTLTYGYFGGKLDYIEYTLPDHAIPGQTPRQQPPGALVPPGSYEAVLTVDGKQYRQKFELVLDPTRSRIIFGLDRAMESCARHQCGDGGELPCLQ